MKKIKNIYICSLREYLQSKCILKKNIFLNWVGLQPNRTVTPKSSSLASLQSQESGRSNFENLHSQI